MANWRPKPGEAFYFENDYGWILEGFIGDQLGVAQSDRWPVKCWRYIAAPSVRKLNTWADWSNASLRKELCHPYDGDVDLLWADYCAAKLTGRVMSGHEDY